VVCFTFQEAPLLVGYSLLTSAQIGTSCFLYVPRGTVTGWIFVVNVCLNRGQRFALRYKIHCYILDRLVGSGKEVALPFV
jgi:hypothetical protein